MMTQEIYQETHLESELRRGDVSVGEPDAIEVGDGVRVASVPHAVLREPSKEFCHHNVDEQEVR